MKRMISMLIVATVIFLYTFSVSFPVSADSLYIRKIVSVVYDDSSSMTGNHKWAYANYAMQAFCGMLNSDDLLYITYMSDSVPQEKTVTSDGIQNSVDSIREHDDMGVTPYGAVETAFDKLKQTQDTNPNTQYWLVVITDGEFQYEEDVDDDPETYLNKKFNKYVSKKMPNGTHPQITFLGIGEGVTCPKNDKDNGIHVYSAKDSSGIIDAMSRMADKVSGRTRLEPIKVINGNEEKVIEKIDSDTIRVSSSIPLLNIAVFTQKSDAQVETAIYDDEFDIPISRKVNLMYDNYSDLLGSACLLGDSNSVIGAGYYDITFSKDVNLENVIVLFEPALEVKMIVELNGKEVTDFDDLENAKENDKISVSYKIFEKWTTKEIDPSLLPPETEFKIVVKEGGAMVTEVVGKDEKLTDYVVKNEETGITASVVIDGFKPIEYKVEFTPLAAPLIPETPAEPKYYLSSKFGSALKSIKYDDIATNKDMTVCFTVLEDVDGDGKDRVPVTDSEKIKSLNPVFSFSPQGNDGNITYSKDGMIVFTPTSASRTASDDGSFEVTVTCSIDGGASASEKYTVLLSDYKVIPTDANQSVKKTELFDNKVSVSFYITKDGVKLGKADVENSISIMLNEEHSELKFNNHIAKDGTITVTPYSQEQHVLTFWNWWINWAYYFGLESDDIDVTLCHTFGNASAVIDVVGEDFLYQILNVYLPLLIEIAVLAYLIWWIYAICAKPKFLPGAVIYMANINYGGKLGDRYHEIDPITEVNLKQYNKFKYRWKPTLNSTKHFIGKNLTISAGYGGSIICHSQLWYKGDITPKNRVREDLSHPQHVKTYINDYGSLKIEVINPYDSNDVHAVESIDNPNSTTYYLHTEYGSISNVNGIQAIEDGTIFAYAIRLR